MPSQERQRAQSCLVTGGSSGIGLATARLLADRGVNVLVMDLQPPPDELPAVYLEGDVTQDASWREAAAVWEREFGGLDFAFLNAGTQSSSVPLTELAPQEWRRTLAINLTATITGTLAVVAPMQQRGGGGIVMTASLAGLIAYPPDPIYAATKHGVVGFARAAAHQFSHSGITVNVVCPGLTDTAFLRAEQRRDIERDGFPLIPSSAVAETVVSLLEGEGTGGIWVCQYGREAIRYEPRGVPGPAHGKTPPSSLAQPAAGG